MKTIDQMVQQEVIYNVNELMQSLNSRYVCGEIYEEFENMYDYEACAWGYFNTTSDAEREYIEENYGKDWLKSVETLIKICEDYNLEPCEYQQDILEYWIVSEWLADKLIAQGEPVAKDIHGLVVWGRTTSGQAISIDSVIEDIYKDTVA